MDKKLHSNQYIPTKEWNKIPPNLQKRIRSKETELGAVDIKTDTVREDKQLTKLYAQARRFADWSYMNSTNLWHRQDII
jgi:hypothetical protein